MRFCLIFAVACLASAQVPFPEGYNEPIFKTDGIPATDPRAQAVVAAVCPNKTIKDGKVLCGGLCPDSTDFSGEEGFERSIGPVTFGSFLAPRSIDAVVSVWGCESHMSNLGGSYLMNQRSGIWRALGYEKSVITSSCRKLHRQDGRELLLCEYPDSSWGLQMRELYVEDMLTPKAFGMQDRGFYSIVDTTLTCGGATMGGDGTDPVNHAGIKSVEFKDLNRDGLEDLIITIYSGSRRLTPEEVKACEEPFQGFDKPTGPPFIIPTKTSRIEFLFDGQTFHQSPQ